MKKVLLLTALVVLLGSASAFAASTQAVSMSITIPQVFELAWSTTTGQNGATIATATVATEWMAGTKTGIPGGTLKATANAAYDLTVKSAAASFTCTGLGCRTTKPTTDIQIAVNGTTYQTTTGITEKKIIVNQAAEVAASKVLLYKIIFTGVDTPGVYSTTLTYTIKAKT